MQCVAFEKQNIHAEPVQREKVLETLNSCHESCSRPSLVSPSEYSLVVCVTSAKSNLCYSQSCNSILIWIQPNSKKKTSYTAVRQLPELGGHVI